MKQTKTKLYESEFNRLFLAAIDETLSALGESAKTAIYFHIEQTFDLPKQDLPKKVNAFSAALDKLFGIGGKSIQTMLLQRLNSKLNGTLDFSAENLTFEAYINKIKENVLPDCEAKRASTPHVEAQFVFPTENIQFPVQKEKESITDPKTAQAEHEQNLSAIFEFSPEALMITNYQATILDCNPATLDLLGVTTKTEVIGQNLFALVQIKNSDHLLTFVQKRLEQSNGTVRNIGCSFINRIGHFVVCDFSVTLIKGSSNEESRFVLIVNDTTTRQNAEKQLVVSEETYSSLCEHLQQTETRLMQEEDTAQSCLDVANVMLLVLDVEGNIVLFNKKGSEILGCSLEEVRGKNWFDEFVSAESRADRREIRRLHLQRNSDFPEYSENEMICRNGKRCTLAGRHIVLHDKTGRVTGTFSSAEDITEQRAIRTALIENEQMFRTIVENSYDVILLCSPESQIYYASPSSTNLLGYTPEELTGKLASTLVHPDDVDMVGKILGSGAIGKRGSCEYRAINKNGQARWVSHSWAPIIQNGRITVLVNIVRDITERRQLVDDLKASEEKFRAIYECAMDAIILSDENAKVVYWNPAAEKIFGYPQDEAVGGNMAELIVPSSGCKHYLELIKQVTTDAFIKQHLECIAHKKDGETFPIEFSIGNVKLPGSHYLLWMINDISQRKEMEATLKRERDMLESITTNIGAGIAIINRDYCIQWINKLLSNIHGNALGKPCYSTFNSLNEICPNCGPAKIFAGAPFDSREVILPESQPATSTSPPSPKCLEVITTPITDKNGNVTAALELTIDITEKKQLEDALREERNKLTAITNNINAGLILVNKEHDILWINRFAANMYELSGQKKCYQLIHGCSSVCSNCGVDRVFNGEELDSREVTVNVGGKQRILEVAVTPIRDKSGKIVAALELGTDVTEMKQLHKKLGVYSLKLEELVRQRTAQLEQTQAKLVKSERLAAIGELAGMVGHDLRNPLTSIKGATYYLKTKYSSGLDETGKDMLSTIERGIDYSNKIINDLLDYSREIHLELTRTNPKALVKESLALISVPKNITIRNLAAKQDIIIVDQPKMTRVILNIVKNSFDAMPKGGILTITSIKAKGNWALSFVDNGEGMTSETLGKLWGPLFTTKAKGMGFGLAICRRIVEAHGGKISVKSTVGQGTEFLISLPLDAKKVAQRNSNCLNVSSAINMAKMAANNSLRNWKMLPY